MKSKTGSLIMRLLAMAGAAFIASGGFSAEPVADFSNEKTVAAVPKVRGAADKDVKERLEWNIKTLVGDYDAVGSRDEAWDAPARMALEGFARVRSNPEV